MKVECEWFEDFVSNLDFKYEDKTGGGTCVDFDGL